MKKVKIGIFGTWRGESYAGILKGFDNVEIVALCDKNPGTLASAARVCPEAKAFDNFDDFIESGMDAVVLCNYFHEHTPYAIRAMERGIHVLSETTPASTLAECVQLCEAVERTGCKYMLAENYPFSSSCLEMARIYQGGTLGKVLYAEGEYVHTFTLNDLKYLTPFETHWRAWAPRTYYLTHSLAPLIHMTGALPKAVNSKSIFAPKLYEGSRRRAVDAASIMLCEMDNGSIFRVTGCAAFAPHGNWYRLACENGGVESIRGDQSKVRLEYNSWRTPEGMDTSRTYHAEWQDLGELAEKAGHGGGDFWVCYHFVKYLTDDVEPFFTVYPSVAMSAVGILAWRSTLEDGKQYLIPDFSDKEARRAVADDTGSPFPDAENCMYPASSKPFTLPPVED